MQPPIITPEYLAEQGLSPTFPKRFWSKVEKTDTCWIFTGSCSLPGGYGQIFSGFRNTPPIRAHVAAWILCVGPIPEGQCVLHDCPSGDNPRCVNPAHLWLGTRGDNNRDTFSKGRMPIGEDRKQSKLKNEDIMEIMAFYKFGTKGRGQTDTAKHFGISQGLVQHIVEGRAWSHITGIRPKK